MSTITTLVGSDGVTTANSMAKINANFTNLNTDKIETSVIDTDTTLAADSDSKLASQKAVKTYVDAGGNVNASETTKGIVEEATDAEVTAGTATGGTGAKLFVTPAKLKGTGLNPVVKTYITNFVSISAATARFDITNPSGTTFRYTYDGTGTDPVINSTTFPTGALATIYSTNFNVANNGSWVITASGNNYFEVDNATPGVAEDDKTLGGGWGIGVSLIQTWTKPTGLKYIIAEVQGAGGAGGDDGGGGGGAGGYTKKLIVTASLGATESIIVAPGGADDDVSTASTTFGSILTSTAGTFGTDAGAQGTGGTGSGGDINLKCADGMPEISAGLGGEGGSSMYGFGGYQSGGAASGYGAGGGGGNTGGGGTAGTAGVVIVTEYYV